MWCFTFLSYVNDLKNVSNLLDPIMFPDDTNLFLKHKDINMSLKRRILNWKESTNGLFKTNSF